MSEIVTAGILVIGDEILSGRTKDKNIGFIAEYLTNIGIDLKEVRVVADNQNTRRDDHAHDFSPPVPVTCASNALKSRGFAAEISTRQPFFRAARRATHTKCRWPMHIALARALLPSREVMHCAAWLREIVRIYGSCLR